MGPADARPGRGAGPAGNGPDDPARLAAVRRLVDALDDNAGLDRLTRLAALLLDAPYAQVSLSGAEHVVVSRHGGSPAHALLPEQPAGGLAHTAGAVGVPLCDPAGTTLGVLSVSDDSPRSWSPEQVGVLAELAESVVAELELRALGVEASRTAARLDLALDASAIGSFDLETDTGALHWDDRLVRLFGYERPSFVAHLDSFNARVHPEDLERVSAAVDQAVASLGELSLEYRIVRPGGAVRWVEARGRVLPARGRGISPRLLGVAYDSTELREARDRLARTLESMNDAFFALDADWRFTYVNWQAERLLGRRREDLVGNGLWEEFPEAVGSIFQERYEQAVAAGEPVVFEAPFEPLGGWYEVNAWPGPDGLSVYFKEITGRRQAERERERAYAEREQAVVERERAYAQAEAAGTRLALLAEASTRLAESLEPRQVLERLTNLVVPALGQWVVVALGAETNARLRGQDGPVDPARVYVVQTAHADAEQREEFTAVAAALRLSTADPMGAGAAVRTGLPEWLPELTDDALAGLLVDGVAPPAWKGARVRALTVPLANRGRVLGAVTVGGMTVDAPAGGPVDRALLTDLAGRAAVALDNALLYGAERRTGLTLQRSLLPREVPAVAGLRTAARYLPGTSGAFVGGDWYQGVKVGDGLVLTMGDVMGHGMRSAARMGQLRAIVATLALEGHGPARLLRRLAASVDVLLDLELATVLVAAYDSGARTLTIASAGHPPPLLAPLTGQPRFLDVEPGPPLGTFAFPYDEVVVDVRPGDTLVLYTDGLVENRYESLDVGLERLRSALADVQLPPEEVCDHVLERLGRGGGGDDDVALLVLSHQPGEDGP